MAQELATNASPDEEAYEEDVVSRLIRRQEAPNPDAGDSQDEEADDDVNIDQTRG